MEAKPKWTQGPWTARKAGHLSMEIPKLEEDYPDHVVTIFHDDQGRRVTAFVAQCNGATLPNAANAALIAAAPDLYDALRWCERQGYLKYSERIKGQNDTFCDDIDKACAALRKAEANG